MLWLLPEMTTVIFIHKNVLKRSQQKTKNANDIAVERNFTFKLS